MFSLVIQYNLRAEMQQMAAEIRIANDYNDAFADWKAARDYLVALRESGILGYTTYQTYSDMLDLAMTE